MGKHYVPRAHLAAFQVDGQPGFVWMFNEKDRQVRRGEHLEGRPGGRVLLAGSGSRARRGWWRLPGTPVSTSSFGGSDSTTPNATQLSLYIMTMATRGPRQRRKSLEHAPEILESVISDTRKEIEEWQAESGRKMQRRPLRG